MEITGYLFCHTFWFVKSVELNDIHDGDTLDFNLIEREGMPIISIFSMCDLNQFENRKKIFIRNNIKLKEFKEIEPYLYCYSEERPTKLGVKYWHHVDGKPMVWM